MKSRLLVAAVVAFVLVPVVGYSVYYAQERQKEREEALKEQQVSDNFWNGFNGVLNAFNAKQDREKFEEPANNNRAQLSSDILAILDEELGTLEKQFGSLRRSLRESDGQTQPLSTELATLYTDYREALDSAQDSYQSDNDLKDFRKSIKSIRKDFQKSVNKLQKRYEKADKIEQSRTEALSALEQKYKEDENKLRQKYEERAAKINAAHDKKLEKTMASEGVFESVF
jgi:chromosome segregation ATPase